MSTRTYLAFGSNHPDQDGWFDIGKVEAGGSDQALNKALKIAVYKHYAVVPERNWSAGTPTVVEREPIVTWDFGKKPEAKPQRKKEDAVAAARDALADEPRTEEVATPRFGDED